MATTKTVKTAAAEAASAVEESVTTMTEQAEAVLEQFELPKSVREFTERSVEQSRAAYGRIKDTAQETTDMFEVSANKAADAAATINLKTIDFAKAHVDASFELARKLLKTRDLSEAFDIQMAFARDRAEACSAQAREFGEIASKATREAGEPFKDQITRSFDAWRTSFSG